MPIFYYICSSLSFLGDTIFLYFLSLNMLEEENGGLLAAAVFGVDSFLQIVAGPLIAKGVDRIGVLRKKINISLCVQPLCALLALTFALFPSAVALLALFVVMRLLLLFDMQLKTELPLYFEEKGVFPLMKSLSFANLALRGTQSLSTVIAPLLLGFSWLFVSGLNALSFFCALLGTFLVSTLIQKMGPFKPKEKEEAATPGSFWSRWNGLFLFLNNLSFGAVALILSKELLIAEGFYMGPSPLFIGLFFALVLIVVFTHVIKPLLKSAGTIALLSLLLALALGLAAFADGPVHGALLVAAGIFYGLSLVGAQSFVLPKLSGRRYTARLAGGQAFGRAGMLLSLLVAGSLIDRGALPSTLLLFSGVVGACSAAVLFLYGRRETQAVVSG